ncbi:hypothetical protein [Streptomyces sp. KR55]|uniref:hypothetical protein n=1 Tax=Streptomyces sp. KR55 TaxID=3457425 RepID=UPI003FD67085
MFRGSRTGRHAALEAEHRRIESVPAEAADGATPSDPTWPDRLMEAMAELRDHILKEQDGVFPAALADLSTEDWEAVEATRAKGGQHPVPAGRLSAPLDMRFEAAGPS